MSANPGYASLNARSFSVSITGANSGASPFNSSVVELVRGNDGGRAILTSFACVAPQAAGNSGIVHFFYSPDGGATRALMAPVQVPIGNTASASGVGGSAAEALQGFVLAGTSAVIYCSASVPIPGGAGLVCADLA